jgi:hypothetical protein
VKHAPTILCTALIAMVAAGASAVDAPPRLTPFSSAQGTALPAPWRIVTLPKIPNHTTYLVETLDGRRAVRAAANDSYANVLHAVNADVAAAPILRFSWRVDQFPTGSDLTTKQGDDLAAKVCILFDEPLDRLSFVDRAKVRLGRALFDPQLPAATLCYAWDRTLPTGRWIDSAYTDRVRLLVLRSGANGEVGRWFDERRDLRADFLSAFRTEAAAGLPRVAAVAFATDADNTHSRALASFGDISLGTE